MIFNNWPPFLWQTEVAANRDLLAEWADQVAEWLMAGDDVFFFFAHIPEDRDAPLLAREFHALANERYTLPPLPTWGDERGEQGSLF